MILMSLPPAGNVAIGQSFQPSLKLTLNEEVLETDENLIQFLSRLTTMVEDMISQFEQYSEEQGAGQVS